MTSRSSGLALSEIRTMKPEEQIWLSIAIEKRSIPIASTNDQQVYGDKRRLLFIMLHSTSARTLAWFDRRAEHAG
jgi:hypothetical protein